MSSVILSLGVAVTRTYCRCWRIVSWLGTIYCHGSFTFYRLLRPDSLYIHHHPVIQRTCNFVLLLDLKLYCLYRTQIVPICREDLIRRSLSSFTYSGQSESPDCQWSLVSTSKRQKPLRRRTHTLKSKLVLISMHATTEKPYLNFH